MLSWNTCSKHKLINRVLCKSLLCYIITGFECYIFTPSYMEIKHVSILMISLIVVHTEFSKYLIHNNWNKAHMFAVKHREKVEKCRRLSNRISDTYENKFILYCFIWNVLLNFSAIKLSSFCKTCIRIVQPRQNNTPC